MVNKLEAFSCWFVKKAIKFIKRNVQSNLSTYAFRVHANHSPGFVKGDLNFQKLAVMERGDKNYLNWERDPKKNWVVIKRGRQRMFWKGIKLFHEKLTKTKTFTVKEFWWLYGQKKGSASPRGCFSFFCV